MFYLPPGWGSTKREKALYEKIGRLDVEVDFSNGPPSNRGSPGTFIPTSFESSRSLARIRFGPSIFRISPWKGDFCTWRLSVQPAYCGLGSFQLVGWWKQSRGTASGHCPAW